MKEKRNRKQFHKILIIAAALMVVILDVLFFVFPDRNESETENRKLQVFPSLSASTLTSGRFESQFDDYISDQFPFRDTWTKAATTITRLAGNTMSNDIFLAGDGFLIRRFDEPSEPEYEKILSGFRETAEKHKDKGIYALIAPTAASSLKELLPANAFSGVSGDENAFLDRLCADLTDMGIDTVDVRDSIRNLNSSGVQAYYRTDHHWTTDAAYEAYKCFEKAAGITDSGTVYDRMLLTDSFQGTLSASSGYRTDQTDEIYVYLPSEETKTEFVMTNLDDGSKSGSLYDVTFLDTRDKYAVFMGGNHGQVKIQTAADTQRRLMIMKDSFANCFIPFLIPDFETVIVIDPRYFQGDMDQVIENEQITDILFLYNAGTI